MGKPRKCSTCGQPTAPGRGWRYCGLACRLLAHRRLAPGGCWEWTAARFREPHRLRHLTTGASLVGNYGIIRLPDEKGRARNRSVHRVAYEVFVGPIPPGLNVLHTCDNPPCFNPAHLRAGTQRSNGRDMVSRGRHDGGAHASHLDEAAVWDIRRRHAEEGTSQRTLAREYGISDAAVSKIVRGHTWKEVPTP